MKIESYRNLEIWAKGIQIVENTYNITKSFPASERYGLCSQMQRAAVSIPVNIAEGFARQYTKEFLQFCYIAKGSAVELETLSLIANKLNFISSEKYDELAELIDHEGKMLQKFISYLKNR